MYEVDFDDYLREKSEEYKREVIGSLSRIAKPEYVQDLAECLMEAFYHQKDSAHRLFDKLNLSEVHFHSMNMDEKYSRMAFRDHLQEMANEYASEHYYDNKEEYAYA